jgi:hypothetical protein
MARIDAIALRRAAIWLALPRNLTAFVACVFSIAAIGAAIVPVADPDVWWVAAAGREMMATHAVPARNIFSFVEPEHAWLMHEWLLGPLYAAGLVHFGPPVFVGIALCVTAVALTLVLAGTVGTARHPTAGLLAAFVAVLFFGGRFLSARPTGVALLFPIALTGLAFAPSFGVVSWALSLLVELLWTNAHGSFPLGVALLVVGAIDRATGRVRRVAAAATAALVTVLNPYGLSLHRFVWGYFRGTEGIYREIHAHIQEFGGIVRAWGSTIGPLDVVGLTAVLALSVFAAARRAHRVRALFCIALLTLATAHARHLELAGLVSCLLLVPFLDDLVEATGLAAASPNWRWRAAALTLVPAYSLGFGFFAFEATRRAPEEWAAGAGSFLPLLDAVPDGSHVYAPFGWAGMAIWYGYPRGVRVFFDSRNDCYSPETFVTFLALGARSAPAARLREQLAATTTDAVLVSSEHPLFAALAGDASWKPVREAGAWRLYLGAPGARRPESPRTRGAWLE